MSTLHLDPEALRALVTRYLEHGDEDAIEELVRLTRPRLLAAARRIGRPTDAEDAVQVAYLSFVRRLRAPLDAPVFPWLLTATLRVAYRKKAAHRRQNEIARALAAEREPAVIGGDPAAAEIVRLVRAKVATLPELYRDVLFLHHIAGLPQEDVALLLDTPVATVRTRLRRGRLMLEGRMPPRLRSSLCAVPWWIADWARTSALTGGIIMAKKSATLAVTATLFLAIGTGTWVFLSADGNDDQRGVPPVSEGEVVGVTQAPEEVRGEGRAAPVLQSRLGKAPIAPEPRRGKPSFGGRVVDPAGEGIAGVRIETIALRRFSDNGFEYVYSRMRREERNAVTGEHGRFEIDPGSARLDREASAIDLLVVGEDGAIARAQARPGEPCTVVLGGAGRFRLTLRDPAGRAVEAADVGVLAADDVRQTTGHFEFHPFLTMKTDAAGRVERMLGEGSYRLHVVAEGYPPVLTDVLEHSAARPLDRTIDLVTGSEVELRVVSEANEPIARATVLLGAPRGSVAELTTDDQGVVRKSGFPLTPRSAVGVGGVAYLDWRAYYYVRVPGYAPAEGSRGLPARAGTVDIEVRMSRGRHVIARVVDDVGAPIENASIGVALDRGGTNPLRSHRRLEFTTDRAGRADLGQLLKRQNLFTVRAGGRDYEWFHKKVQFPKEGELRIVLRRKGARVSGRALGPNDEVVGGLRVGWSHFEQGYTRAAGWASTKVGEDGAFLLENVMGGEGHVVLRAPGFAPQRIELAVPPGSEVTGVEARLSAEGRIAGQVISRKGTPFPGIAVTLSQEATTASGGRQTVDVAATMADSEGRFAFLGVPEGETYRLGARTKEWIQTDWRKFSKLRRGDDDLRVVLKPKSEGSGIPLRVRITSAGKPHTDPVSLTWQQGESGTYGCSEVADTEAGVRRFSVWTGAGTYVFTFTAPGHRPYTTPEIRLLDSPDSPVIDVALDRGAKVEFRILLGGEPLAHTSLEVRGNWESGMTRDTVTTDEHGFCALHGFAPGVPATVRVHRQDDPYTDATLKEISAPDRIEVTLRRHGILSIQGPGTFGDLTANARATLIGPNGKQAEEKTLEPRTGKRAQWSLSTRFYVYAPGRYRVELVIDGRTYSTEVEMSLGQRVRRTVE